MGLRRGGDVNKLADFLEVDFVDNDLVEEVKDDELEELEGEEDIIFEKKFSVYE